MVVAGAAASLSQLVLLEPAAEETAQRSNAHGPASGKWMPVALPCM
jgi:hypothetical protein